MAALGVRLGRMAASPEVGAPALSLPVPSASTDRATLLRSPTGSYVVRVSILEVTELAACVLLRLLLITPLP